MKTKVYSGVILFVLLSVLSSLQAANSGLDYTEISCEELKSMMNSHLKINVVDARTKYYDDRVRIPGAISLPCTSNKVTIATTFPQKYVYIAIYCSNVKSPQARFLAEKMVSMGYKRVMVCTEGLQGWQEYAYPTEYSRN